MRWLALALLMSAAPAWAQSPLRHFGADGGDFRAELQDGTVLRGRDLVGATLSLTVDGQPLTLRIEDAEPDAGSRAPDVWLFTLSVLAPDGTRQDLCTPDPEGRRLAIPYSDGSGGLSLTCSSGGVGKCMRMGYRPWAVAPDGRTRLAPYHAACVNLLRGAYGGDHAWTRDGTAVDIYDRIGVQAPDNDPAQAFEAGWDAAGAVCLAHPRVPENGGLLAIAATAPRLAGRTGSGVCTEDAAAAWGALLFNRSRPPG
ncbi:MAG: hypothetical protein K2X11_11060 [Acetobacteraceae bacterium]|nr:hypothetical protein [Acetobacteraceae bacterium]